MHTTIEERGGSCGRCSRVFAQAQSSSPAVPIRRGTRTVDPRLGATTPGRRPSGTPAGSRPSESGREPGPRQRLGHAGAIECFVKHPTPPFRSVTQRRARGGAGLTSPERALARLDLAFLVGGCGLGLALGSGLGSTSFSGPACARRRRPRRPSCPPSRPPVPAPCAPPCHRLAARRRHAGPALPGWDSGTCFVGGGGVRLALLARDGRRGSGHRGRRTGTSVRPPIARWRDQGDGDG